VVSQGGGEEFYENSWSMTKGGGIIELCRSWAARPDGNECEIGPLD
jgi:hypothetical protein